MTVCWIGIIVDGVATLVGAFVVLLARIAVGGAKWMMWRISNYPKGPLTAVLTLIGAVLAIIKIFTGK